MHRLDRTSFAWRTYSITSSASASSGGGVVNLITVQALRLAVPPTLLARADEVIE